MRVVHLLRKYNPKEWGGTESALLQLCEGLHQRGVASVVYCPRTSNGFDADPLAESGCRIKRFKAFLPIWGISQQRRRQLIAVGGNLMSLELIGALWREPEVSIIHTHTLGRLGGIGLTVAKRRKLPIVVTIHGGYLDLPESVRKDFTDAAKGGWEWGKMFGAFLQARWLLEKADAVLTCNPPEAELLRNRYPHQRIIVHPHGVIADRYRKDYREHAREAFPEIRDRQVLLTVGRVDPQKNQVWLVEQAPTIFKKHPKAILVIAGSCTHEAYGEQLKRRIETLGLEEKIVLTGGLPPADARLIGLYQDATVVLLPSHTETFGLVILEGWAAGRSVISSRTSGASSLITHGRDGWLFDLNKPTTFHAAVDQALLEPTLAGQLAAAGHQRVRDEYDASVLADRVKGLYKELIQRNHALRHSPGR